MTLENNSTEQKMGLFSTVEWFAERFISVHLDVLNSLNGNVIVISNTQLGKKYNTDVHDTVECELDVRVTRVVAEEAARAVKRTHSVWLHWTRCCQQRLAAGTRRV